MRATLPALLAALLALAACTPHVAVPPAPTVNIPASGETAAVATPNADAADDPAIWRNAANPQASLIIGTDKKAGLYVYDLTGRVRDFLDAGRVNNVDLATFRGQIIVAASDRNDNDNARIALFTLNPATAKLTSLAAIPAGPGEAYGICLYPQPNALHAFIVLKDGTIRQYDLTTTATPRLLRTLKLATQSEGCVVDPISHRLYVAEEDTGLWRFDARHTAPATPTAIARIDNQRLTADVEGLAIADGHLIASSQGDNAYAVYRLSDDRYIGRFRINPARFGATQETDGIEVIPGNFGPTYPDGLMVAQDGENAPAAQNFKLVSWGAVKAALNLK